MFMKNQTIRLSIASNTFFRVLSLFISIRGYLNGQSVTVEGSDIKTYEWRWERGLLQDFSTVALMAFGARSRSMMGCSPVHGRTFGSPSLLYPQDTTGTAFPPAKLWQPKLSPDFAKYLIRGDGERREKEKRNHPWSRTGRTK